ncbi:HTH_Tnp_Tc3_2 domain-containing protein [Trichonephila clavipes]|nr:HTH_Tnp_Tc3_2 domain-containing protein [Trichonephila clavipes]
MTTKLHPKTVQRLATIKTPSTDQSSRRPPHLRNARVQPTVSSAAIQAQVAPSIVAPMSYRIIRKRVAEEHLGSRRPLRVLPLTPTNRRLHLEWCHARRKRGCLKRQIQIHSQQ